ncbi:MAG: serine--tRNA ligase [Spirochaetales bacterium]|nr:serine--tRNA ligase [Spirochaetales bacterium]MCF7938390.1 serine--tRNA ligase [Spirochaetales bacterium]
MLDLRFIQDHREEVIENIRNRQVDTDIDRVISLYQQRNSLIHDIEELRSRRNENARAMKGKMEPDKRNRLIEEGKQLKESIAEQESVLSSIETELNEAAYTIPNMSHPDAPVGSEEGDNRELRQWGTVPSFNFKPLDHVELGEKHDLIDFDTAARVSGAKFYYLKNEAALLEIALTRYAMDVLVSHGFTPTVTPDIAREDILVGIGFNPRGEESNIYTIEDSDNCLIGTAEITLGGYHAGTMLESGRLPIRMAGLSHCFRREAGAAGKYSRGLYRVHQFTKVEMFVYCMPEESARIHEELLSIEEEIFQGLEVPYRVVDTCTGDLGGPAYRKYDLEAWMPGRDESGNWGEITSTSNTTDYQARRLGVRYKDADGNKGYVHMLNGTAIAVSRAIIAILENFQQADGSIRIPSKLVPYTGFDVIGKSGS